MTLQIPIPEGLDEATIIELGKAARQLIGIRLYQQGKLSHGKLAEFLGIGRGQLDELLGAHGILDEFTAQEIATQVKASRNLRR